MHPSEVGWAHFGGRRQYKWCQWQWECIFLLGKGAEWQECSNGGAIGKMGWYWRYIWAKKLIAMQTIGCVCTIKHLISLDLQFNERGHLSSNEFTFCRFMTAFLSFLFALFNQFPDLQLVPSLSLFEIQLLLSWLPFLKCLLIVSIKPDVVFSGFHHHCHVLPKAWSSFI